MGGVIVSFMIFDFLRRFEEVNMTASPRGSLISKNRGEGMEVGLGMQRSVSRSLSILLWVFHKSSSFDHHGAGSEYG